MNMQYFMKTQPQTGTPNIVSPQSARDLSSVPICGVLIIALFALLFGLGIHLSAALPASILLSLTGTYFLQLAVGANRDIFGPVTFVAAYFTLDIGCRSIYLLLSSTAHRMGRVGYDDYIPVALWCAVLAYTCFLFGFHSKIAKNLVRTFRKRDLLWPSRVPTLRIVILLALGIGAMLFLLWRYGADAASDQAELTANPPPGYIVLLRQALYVGWTATCVCLLAKRVLNKRSGWFLLALSLVFLAVNTAMSAGKQSLLEPLLEGLIVFHYLRKRLRIWQIVAIAVPAVIIAFGALNFYRFAVVAKSGSTKSLSDVSSRVSTAFDRIGSGSDGERDSAFDQMMNRQVGVDALALSVKMTPSPQPFGLGRSYLDAFVAAFIPRQLWPNKPVYDAGREFEQKYLAMPTFYNGHTSAHLIGDFYRNFSFIGLIVGTALLGISYRWLYLFCSPGSQNPAGVFIYALLLPRFFHYMEGDVGYILVNGSRLAILVFAAALLIGLRRRSASR